MIAECIPVASQANGSANFPTDSESQRRRASLPRNRPVSDAIAIQQALMAAMLDEESSPAAKAQCARAWRDIQDLIDEKRGLGKPAQVLARNDPANPRRRAKSFTGPAQPANPTS